MKEGLGGPNRKIPIAERFPEKAAQLHELQEFAKTVEDKLREAFGSAPGKGKVSDALAQVHQTLIDIAEDASEFADQYRKFKVGGVMLALRKTEYGHQNPWAVLFDANTKSLPTDDKWCAEQYLMDRMQAEHIERVLGFVVVGKAQADDDSKVEQVTLTPCKLCRDRMLKEMRKPDAAIQPDTEIITANLENTKLRKYQKVEDLQRFHRELPPGYAEID